VSRGRIIISALRRSGSTIFWRCFRNATEALCFDEPFNPNLIRLPRPHEKNIDAEYLRLLNQDPMAFWNAFHPIYPVEELDPSLKPQTAEWLEWMCDGSAPIVLDTTRCWNKIDALADRMGSNTYLIHLHRAPAAFAASHLLPSDMTGSLLGKWNLFKRRRAFFHMDGGFNFWGIEDIVGNGDQSAFASRILQDTGLTDRFYSWTAHAKLLYFWKVAYSRVEEAGRSAFGDRFCSVSYEDFSRTPEKVLTEIQDCTGLSMEMGHLPNVRPSTSVFRAGDSRWYEAAEKVGLPTEREFLFRLP
jgi:hypothetical protein